MKAKDKMAADAIAKKLDEEPSKAWRAIDRLTGEKLRRDPSRSAYYGG